ncbi:MAG: chloride channel protein, partial [Bacteroidales bacterium]|nr:chloride channel protein [Bacteroidales bacterium]
MPTTTARTHSNPFLHLPEKTRLLLLSLAAGVLSGLAASLLWWSIESIKSLIVGAGSVGHRLLLLALPGAGMLLSLLALRFLVKDDISHGVTKVLLAVSRNESRIKPHNTWSSILTSALTIGFGGSVGAEAPIVYTGAAIGSNLGQRAGLSYRSVTILLGCGAAGALAGIFKAPLAGVLFTMEILLFNITLSSMLPLLVSTISATVTASLLRGQTPLFACELTPFSMGNLPFYIVLGIILGFGALYFTNTTLWLEDKIARIRSPYLRWALCASALGLMIFLFPELYGEGYSVVS